MTFQPLLYADWAALLTAAIVSDVHIYDERGQVIQPDFLPGSTFGAIRDVVALTLDAFSRQTGTVQNALTLATSTGTDLDALVAITGTLRNGGTFALVPVKFTRFTPSALSVVVPTGKRVLAVDQTGSPSIVFITQQDPTQTLGTCTVIPSNGASAWGWCIALVAGSGGNVAAGQIVQSDPLTGVDTVSNPSLLTASAPTIATTGAAGSTTYQYQIVARGVYGTTLPSGIGQTTTGNATLNGTNYNTASWPAVVDAVSYDVLKNTGSTGSPVWALLANTSATSLNDQGQAVASASYSMPATNSTNMGAGGVDPETDTSLRLRTQNALAAAARSTSVAIQTALLAIPQVQKAFVVDANGSTQPNGTITVKVVGSSNPLPAATQTLITSTINATKAAGIVVSPAWSMLVPTPVAIAYTLTTTVGQAANTALALTDINAALAAYFATLNMGDPARYSAIITTINTAIANNASIVSTGTVAYLTALTLTASGTPFSGTDVPGVAGTLYSEGAVTATVT